jgi:thiamine-monophosphate kinase
LPSEFELIERCFKRRTHHTLLGIGDDGALIVPTIGHELVVSTDLLVEGTHFFATTDTEDLGWKTLAVNVSDMAAMGAQPRWATLGIAVPPAPTFSWLDDFARGFFACADEFGVDLIGGDTTRGPRCFAVTIMGEVPTGQALRRSGAQRGDQIWVSGQPGRAARGLAHLQGQTALGDGQLADCLAALHRPQPRVALGLALRGIASAAIDVSDGLLADLGHILEESGCSATLDRVPADADTAYLAGGDDYELVFTAAPACAPDIQALAGRLQLPLTCLGRIEAGPPGSLHVVDATGRDITPAKCGFDHFR